MTRDEIMALAKKTGLAIWHTGLKRWQLEYGVADFAKLVAERERESMIKNGWRQCAVGQKTTQFCSQVEAIRAKGEK